MRLNRLDTGSFSAIVLLVFCFLSPVSIAEKRDSLWIQNEKPAEVKTPALDQSGFTSDEIYLKKYAEAQKLLEERLFDQAIKQYQALAKKYKRYPAPQNDIGVIYRLQEKYELAIRQFNKVIKRFPEYAPAYENLADTLTHLASAAYLTAAQHAEDNEVLQKKAELSSTFHQLAMQSVEEDIYADQERRNKVPVSQQVVNTMHSWISAWNKRDLSTYLSHYSSDFAPDRGKTIQEWAKRHKDNFTGSDFIRVYLDSIKMRQLDEKTVAVSFRELYESNLYEATAKKEIVMERVRSSWLIKSEQQI